MRSNMDGNPVSHLLVLSASAGGLVGEELGLSIMFWQRVIKTVPPRDRSWHSRHDLTVVNKHSLATSNRDHISNTDYAFLFEQQGRILHVRGGTEPQTPCPSGTSHGNTPFSRISSPLKSSPTASLALLHVSLAVINFCGVY